MGRYIDEDRLYSDIEEKYKVAQGDARKAYNDVLDTICEIPTADVQEVRHGRWNTINSKVTQCSVCGVSRDIRTQVGWNFCPVCGAKMGEEEQE